MTASLLPCPECQRHVRVSEVSCPFCAAALPSTFSKKARPIVATRRLSRAALFALGGLAAAPIACSGETEDDTSEDGADGVGGDGADGAGGDSMMAAGGDQPQAVYGAPATGGMEVGQGGGAIYGTAPTGGAEMGSGGELNDTGGQSSGGETAQAVYGAPPEGETGGRDNVGPGDGGGPASGGGAPGAGGAPPVGGQLTVGGVYGAPPNEQ